jgi:NAD(P)-dependent dehydrogenase (short-subunit alcohol dehydrogenase family)
MAEGNAHSGQQLVESAGPPSVVINSALQRTGSVLVGAATGHDDNRYRLVAPHATADGLEHTFALNHLAPFLRNNLLLDRLTASAPATVVTVSSGAHAMGRLDFDDLQSERKYSAQHAYKASKLANVMFTYELARRLHGSGVTATVLHPWRGEHRL